MVKTQWDSLLFNCRNTYSEKIGKGEVKESSSLNSQVKLSGNTSPATDHSDKRKTVALMREKRARHLKNHPILYNMFLSQLIIQK